MRGLMIAILGVILIALILTLLWPAIMAAIGAVLGFWAFNRLRIAKSAVDKVLYSILLGIGALIILANLKGILVVAVIVAIIYFLMKNRRKNNHHKNTFDYPYTK
ncbi:hypothetical protein [Listeria sp. PSOL-1]|uniref:lmo0954 family membrane protein n=1 Tax=Listeria sp. PSOL-1 TaxID=1844999 RepID=UPI0013D6AC01|nr:hypothetical protein [Listeria sp. PSOL-1]